MTRIILNCPVKKLCNINFNIDSFFFERTNDRPGQPEEPGKPEINPGAPGKIDPRGLHPAQKIVQIDFLL